MPNYRLLLEYDGSDFEGWQLQPAARTVQGCLVDAFAAVCGERPQVTASGRTDTGVHAEGQVANARVAKVFEPDVLLRALNANLPRDVAVRGVTLAAEDFDARRCARSKLYRYRVWNAPARSPLRARRALHVPQPLDLAAMRRAAADLCGRHDFACFRAAGSSAKTSVREILRLEVVGEAGGELAIEVEGTGFLRHMVRNLAGTLLEVGRGRRAADSMPALLASRDRGQAGATAAPEGLTLVAVRYAEEEAGAG